MTITTAAVSVSDLSARELSLLQGNRQEIELVGGYETVRFGKVVLMKKQTAKLNLANSVPTFKFRGHSREVVIYRHTVPTGQSWLSFVHYPN